MKAQTLLFLAGAAMLAAEEAGACTYRWNNNWQIGAIGTAKERSLGSAVLTIKAGNNDCEREVSVARTGNRGYPPHQFVVLEPPRHGKVMWQVREHKGRMRGYLTYRPDPGYTGSDSFVWAGSRTFTDGKKLSRAERVQVRVIR